MAELLETVMERHRNRQLTTVALMVWSEALRNPVLAGQMKSAVASMSRDTAAWARERQRAGAWIGVPADVLA